VAKKPVAVTLLGTRPPERRPVTFYTHPNAEREREREIVLRFFQTGFPGLRSTIGVSLAPARTHVARTLRSLSTEILHSGHGEHGLECAWEGRRAGHVCPVGW